MGQPKERDGTTLRANDQAVVYYNEFDRKKAAWLRELIGRNLIAKGEVDERSIADVRGGDLEGFTQCHFFAGIGIWSYALRLAGWPDEKEAWTGSCPCQPFSAAGKGEAFDDERHLWPELFRIFQARRPVICFGEQVSSIDGLAWFDSVQADLDREDYTCGVLDTCAAGVGAPHWRQRLYWMAYAAKRDRDGQSRSIAERQSKIGRHGISGGMADSEAARLSEQERGFHQETGAPTGFEQSSATKRLDNSTGSRSDRPQQGTKGNSRDGAWLRLPGERSVAERLDDAESIGRRGRQDIGDGGRRVRAFGSAGPVNGFWRESNWVLTRPQRVGDSPGLRPVEPGSFPLAHGTSERVGRLRGYGDGIVAQAAEMFIRACMDMGL
jgi:DNA (cytosine-5)-methyltransferase 1